MTRYCESNGSPVIELECGDLVEDLFALFDDDTVTLKIGFCKAFSGVGDLLVVDRNATLLDKTATLTL